MQQELIKLAVNRLTDHQIHIDQTITTSRKVAFLTFLVASVLILIFYLSEINGMIYFSMLFTVLAFFINTYYFVKLITEIKESYKVKQIFLTLLLMLLNIPLGFFYLEIGLKIYSQSNPI